MRLLKINDARTLNVDMAVGQFCSGQEQDPFLSSLCDVHPTEQLFSNGRLEVRQLADCAGRDLPHNNKNASSVHCAMLVAEGAVVYFVVGPKRGSINR